MMGEGNELVPTPSFSLMGATDSLASRGVELSSRTLLRTVTFPPDRSLGDCVVAPLPLPPLDYVGRYDRPTSAARGIVAVPAGEGLLLYVEEPAEWMPVALETLDPLDVNWLSVRRGTADALDVGRWLATISRMRGLTALDLWGTALCSDEVEGWASAIARLTRLERLVLSVASDSASVSALAWLVGGLRHLKSLSLDFYDHLDDPPPRHHQISLQSQSIEWLCIDDMAERSVLELAIPTLKHLHVRYQEWMVEHATIEHLLALPQLKSVNLSGVFSSESDILMAKFKARRRSVGVKHISWDGTDCPNCSWNCGEIDWTPRAHEARTVQELLEDLDRSIAEAKARNPTDGEG